MIQLKNQNTELKKMAQDIDIDKWKKQNPSLVREMWNVVERVVLAEYETIKELTMRNSYYHLLPILTELMQAKEISYEQFKYFEANYEYYQGDKWPAWERHHNISRPTSKDPTIGLYKGEKRVFAYASEEDFLFHRARGFLFIEKSGFLNELEELSENGWVILAGEGFASREIREQIAANHPDKPILVMHDYDCAGEAIQNVWEKGSRRTEHLDLQFGNIIDLGLTEEDVKELDLPKQPEVARYRDQRKWRYEINALTVLRRRYNIKNPILWFVVRKMWLMSIPICKEEVKKDFILTAVIKMALRELLNPTINRIVNNEVKEVEDIEEGVQDVEFREGFQLTGNLDFPPELLNQLQEIVKILISNTITLRNKEIEKRILKSAQVI